MNSNKKIAVIGAGIAGITAAYYAVKAGYSVDVFDQERHPAMRTSYANGGQISVSNSEVWNTWSNVKKGAKWMFKKDAPLLIRPTLEWAKIKWMTKFLWHTVKGDYARNTATTIKLGIKARALYADIIAEEGLKFDQLHKGILHFYKDEDYFDSAKSVKELYNANGCEWDMIPSWQIKKIDPALRDIQGAVGGAWTPSDWTGDIHLFCKELANVLQSKYGVNFFYNTKINDLGAFHHYDNIIVSNGVGSVALAKAIGDVLPIYPVKGYSITINNVDPQYLPKVSLLDDQAKIVTATLGNRLRVAGTAELAGENYDIRRDRIEPLLAWVHTNFPKIDTSDYSSWACLRPMTPNMLPIVKQSKKDTRVFYHTGHGHLGWTLSPATAKQVIELIKQ